MKQYWLKVRYNNSVQCDNPLWMLTQGVFRNVTAVYRAYQHQAKAMNYEILEVKERE